MGFRSPLVRTLALAMLMPQASALLELKRQAAEIDRRDRERALDRWADDGGPSP